MFAKLALDANGRVNMSAIPTAPTAPIAVQQYDATHAYAVTDAVAATDQFTAGFRYTSDGALRVYDATGGLPSPVNSHRGIAMSSDGAACITTDVITSAFLINGISLTGDGRIYVNFTASSGQHLLTEGGDTLVTESGNQIITG